MSSSIRQVLDPGFIKFLKVEWNSYIIIIDLCLLWKIPYLLVIYFKIPWHNKRKFCVHVCIWWAGNPVNILEASWPLLHCKPHSLRSIPTFPGAFSFSSCYSNTWGTTTTFSMNLAFESTKIFIIHICLWARHSLLPYSQI